MSSAETNSPILTPDAATTEHTSTATTPPKGTKAAELSRREPKAIAGHRSGKPPAHAEAAWDRDSYSATAFAELLDRAAHAGLGRMSAGLSPGALAGAYLDWAAHLAVAPGKQMELVHKAQKKYLKLGTFILNCVLDGGENCIDPLPQDRRFSDEAWRQWPFNVWSQSFLLTQQWWHNATTGVRGVTPQHERVVEFAARQLLDMAAPSNFLLTNPQVLKKTAEERGMNLVRGIENYIEDWNRLNHHRPPVGAEEFKVSETLAVTPGKVVYRNRLIELIQYEPTTDKVRAEPILITPAWIMKYYILDLSPHNSMVKYLVDQGFTVFMISWRNPTPEDRDLGFDDYRTLGVMAALDAIEEITDAPQVHGVGYCLGGTLLGVASSAMAGLGDDRFASLSFFAAQFDFEEAGELTLFINESQVTFLEDVMWEQGFLDTSQMAGAFQMLRSKDLIWSHIQQDYLMGERAPMIDLMAWNADATRMPYRMHSEYLRWLFLNNDLAEGRFEVDGKTIAMSDIRAPIFSVGTTRDHVAPWRSAFKVHWLTDTDVTFLLTKGGHNAGIVSEPGRKNRSYRMLSVEANDKFIDPDSWVEQTPEQEGSWWPAWTQWLDEHSSTKKIAPPKVSWAALEGAAAAIGPELSAAPGSYILMK